MQQTKCLFQLFNQTPQNYHDRAIFFWNHEYHLIYRSHWIVLMHCPMLSLLCHVFWVLFQSGANPLSFDYAYDYVLGCNLHFFVFWERVAWHWQKTHVWPCPVPHEHCHCWSARTLSNQNQIQPHDCPTLFPLAPDITQGASVVPCPP